MSNLYLTATSADAAVTVGSDPTKYKADVAPGVSATHLNKNTVTGPTAPLQMTTGAAGFDGNLVSWYSPPLQAITIAGQVVASLWTRENATANNVAPTIRIERCAGDGTVLSTIVAETTNLGAGECATTSTGASDIITITAANTTDTTLADGDRLRITLFIDDASGQGGTGSMASGGRGEAWFNGPTGSQGQAQIAFTEELSVVGSVAFDAAASNKVLSSNTVSWSHTCSGTNRVLLVDVALGVSSAGDTQTAGVTYNGVAMTSIGKVHTNASNVGWVERFVLIAPATGSNTVAVTASASVASICGGSMSFKSASQTLSDYTVTSNTGDSANATVTQTTPAATSQVMGGHGGGGSFSAVGQTSRYNVANTSSTGCGNLAGNTAPGTGSNVTLTATLSSDFWASLATEIKASAGKTAVGAELALSWDVRAALGDPIQAIWDVRAAISDDLVGIWDVRALITDSIALSWDLRSIIGDNLDLSYDVRAALGQTLAVSWDVRAFLADTLALSWDIRTFFNDDLALSWDIRAALGDTLALVWDTRAPVSDDLALSWDIDSLSGAVGKTLGISWDTRALVNDDLALSWDIRTIIGDPLALSWDLRAIVADPVALSWDVRSTVGDLVSLSWDVRAFVAGALAVAWDIRSSVGDPIILTWDTRFALGDELSLVWDVDSLGFVAGASLGLTWDVRAPVTADVSVRWDIRTVLGNNLGIAWDVRALAADAVQALWDVRSIVGDPLLLQWDIRSPAGDDLALIWNIRAAIGDDLVLIWDADSDLILSHYSLKTEVLERWWTGVGERNNGVVTRWNSQVLERWRTEVRDENA